MMKKISVIIPVYNEELVIKVCYDRLTSVMDSLKSYNYELIFVNDGSRDSSFAILDRLAKDDKRLKILNFSRNFGHQVAISAGMDNAHGDAVVIIDADLQDPPEVILDMVKKWEDGYDVVYGKRAKRKGETFFKKITAKSYYRLIRSMTNIDLPVDVGDFRLIDKKICDIMRSLTERNRYVRGIISWLGFKQGYVEFIREERYAGETKYPLKKMIKFAADGIISFSDKPLKIATYIGFCTSFLSFLVLLGIVVQKIFFSGTTIDGWASTIAINLFFNGIFLIILGVLGEYVGRIYEESKNRPYYILNEKVNFDEED